MLKLRFLKQSTKQYMDGRLTICKYDCAVVDNDTKAVKATFTVSGSAKCAPEDTVDEEFGKKLADSRAKLNAYKYASHIISPYEEEELASAVYRGAQMLGFLDYMQYLKKREVLHIKSICNSEP